MAKHTHNRGFTLPELLICVLILVLLATMGLAQYKQYVEKSRHAPDLTNMRAAYDEAVYAYMTTAQSGDWLYDAQSGQLVTDYVPNGYGQSHSRADGEQGWLRNYDVPFTATGIPNVNGRARLLHVSVDENGTVTMEWRDSLDGKAYLASRAEP